VKAVIPHTRRERVANYGDAVNVKGQGRAAAFTLSKQQGFQFTITAQVEEFTIPLAAIGTADFRPYLHIEWGHGASIARTDVDITWGRRIPLVCSTAQAQLFIKPLPFPGQALPVPPVPDGAICKARTFISEGIEGTRLFPTFWQTQISQRVGVFSTAAARLVTFRGFNPAAAPGGATTSLFLLVFDQDVVPVAGDVPMDAVPLPFNSPTLPATAVLPLGETRAFVHGIAWGVSSTAFLFTDVPAAAIQVAAEIEQ
jgi:hypothetical protein